MRTRRTIVTLLGVLALLLAACPADEDTPEIDPEAPTQDGEAPDEETGDDADGDVAVGETTLGEILVDGEGMTLYMFDQDEPGTSNCYDDCASAWPPLEADDPVAGDGVDESLLGTTEREDGTVQVTYDEMPLYHWAGDQQPGDVEGQGVNDVWWVVAPDGQPVRDAADEEDAGGAY